MGILYVVATPIGNLEDITIRAIKTLLSVPVIACEDTRHTGFLIKHIFDLYGASIANIQAPISKKKYISVRDWNEAEAKEKVLVELEYNDVALVSDAGTPLISDPGFKLVREARARGINVVPIPGASAVVTALSASGLPTNKFTFLGFLPKKWEIRPEETTVIYESPTRTDKTLAKILERYPEAQIVIASEMTKIYERIIDYETSKMRNGDEEIKGEVTILVYLKDSGRS